MTPALEHRRFLEHPAGFRPFQATDLFARIGGQPSVDALVDALYDAFEGDAVLRPLFVRDLTHERANQKRFFCEWLGGARRYSDTTYAGLEHRHEKLPLTRALAGRWLGHFRRALESAVANEADRAVIFEQAQSLAFALASGARAPTGHEVSSCSTRQPLSRAAELARRGDARGLDALLDEVPALLRRPSQAASVLQPAVLSGRLEIVEALLRRGVDPDKPHWLPIGEAGPAFERVLFITPLCAARLKRRRAIVELLTRAGAKDDLFTAAFLGDTATLEAVLSAGATSAQATDPAVDVLDITAVHHAVAGGRLDALRLLLDRAEPPLVGSARTLRGAAGRDDAAMVALLLEHGADASQIGVGRWVLSPTIAPMIAAAGGAIDRSGAWIGACCTGNQGRRDDPEYVRALLRHGARATDRRTDGLPPSAGGAAVGYLGATALHYAAKAGFIQTIEVLLEHGADPNAQDSRGRTPLDWLQDAAKSVDQRAVERALRTKR